MVIVWVLISTISLISALIIQQELACGWSYWQIKGSRFFNSLSCFGPQTRFHPQWCWRLGGRGIDLVYHPHDYKIITNKDYEGEVFKLGNFCLVIWSN